MYPACTLQRNAHIWPNSAGVPNRLAGIFAMERAAASKKSGEPESDMVAQAIAKIPARRFGTPAEFGQICAFLCSAHASYITGQNLLLDGGAYPAAF